MVEFSTVDGFVEISESLTDMIKYLANEPSVGLFYVQQHTQNAVPNVIKLKNKVSEKSRETSLHTEDLEDSLAAVRSMKQCGSHIVQGMIGDINNTLAVMSAKEPRRGAINRQHSGFSIGKGTSWGPATWGKNPFSSELNTGISGNYITTVFKSAKEKASNLKWPPLELIDRPLSKSEEPPSASASELIKPVTTTSTSSTVSSVPGYNEQKVSSQDPSVLAEEFDEFKAEREAKLREWLEGIKSGGNENGDSQT